LRTDPTDSGVRQQVAFCRSNLERVMAKPVVPVDPDANQWSIRFGR
jgi:hypothetical protein